MSSDREKLKALKALSDVAQYVLHDKRDAERVHTIMQFIIDESEKKVMNWEIHWRERAIIDKLILKVLDKSILFKLHHNGMTGRINDVRSCKVDYNLPCKTSVDDSCYISVTLQEGDKNLVLPLNPKDKEIFLDVLKKERDTERILKLIDFS